MNTAHASLIQNCQHNRLRAALGRSLSKPKFSNEISFVAYEEHPETEEEEYSPTLFRSYCAIAGSGAFLLLSQFLLEVFR